MNADNSTSMTLKNVSSGLTMALTGTSGTITSSATVMALTGYDIATEETDHGVSYSVVSVSGKKSRQNGTGNRSRRGGLRPDGRL